VSVYGWESTLFIFASLVLLIVPLSLSLTVPPHPQALARQQSLIQALTEAFGHRSYVLLILGYFTCGFQTFFMGVHLPTYLIDRGLPMEIGGWALAIIGLFNIIGSISSGWLGNLMPRRFILAGIYFMRSVVIGIYIALPTTAAGTLVFAAVIGLLWLSTIPPTSSLVATMFGARWLAMLLGIAFVTHQVGGFLGVWLGGLLFERTGSYDTVWIISILLGLLSAVINLPIVEKPVHRIAAASA
jgi:predicted MFS family arabinose efflux permease